MKVKGIIISTGGLLIILWGLVKLFQAEILYQGESEAWSHYWALRRWRLDQS